jgi:hypothetical protein
MTDTHEHWPELHALLLGVLDQIGPVLDPKNRELVADFIENREFEIAFRWMTSAIQEQRIQMSDETAGHLGRAATLMRIDP